MKREELIKAIRFGLELADFEKNEEYFNYNYGVPNTDEMSNYEAIEAYVNINHPDLVDYVVACDVCNQRYKNHAGSTECCGSTASLLDEEGVPTNSYKIYGSINGGDIQEITIKK